MAKQTWSRAMAPNQCACAVNVLWRQSYVHVLFTCCSCTMTSLSASLCLLYGRGGDNLLLHAFSAARCFRASCTRAAQVTWHTIGITPGCAIFCQRFDRNRSLMFQCSLLMQNILLCPVKHCLYSKGLVIWSHLAETRWEVRWFWCIEINHASWFSKALLFF